jgi:hypothetical protein
MFLSSHFLCLASGSRLGFGVERYWTDACERRNYSMIRLAAWSVQQPLSVIAGNTPHLLQVS